MSLTSLVYRACSHFGLSTPRELRKWFFVIFRHSLFIQKQLKRRGKCKRTCSFICCKGCEWLVDDVGDSLPGCKDWQNRPFFCKIFPVDEKERNGVYKGCSYYWDSERL